MVMLLSFVSHRSVRQMAQEQFFLMATRCCMGHRPLLFFITLLFTVLGVSCCCLGFIKNIIYPHPFKKKKKCIVLLIYLYTTIIHHHSARHLNCLQDPNFKCSRVQPRSEPNMLETTSLYSDTFWTTPTTATSTCQTLRCCSTTRSTG